MPKRVDFDSISRAIARETASSGPLSQSELARRLKVSQASISRVLAKMRRAVRIGKGRSTRFAVRRIVPGIDEYVPVYRINEDAELLPEGELIPLFDSGFAWSRPDGRADYFDGWPYRLEPLRPSGFLGRHIPKVHPELELPDRVEDWNDDDVLRYASRVGWNMPGDLVLGHRPQQAFLRAVSATLSTSSEGRLAIYRRRVDDVLSEQRGSSAGGEQPKFLSVVGGRAHIVKFSPRLEQNNPIARRWADLLVCEHLALETLRDAGVPSSETRLITDQDRYFLEIERFDRVGMHGRRGVLSLQVLQAEFGESKDNSWLGVATDLARQGKAASSVVEHMRLQQTFGRLIANTDMHLGNASVFVDGERIVGPTPVYDMLPMHWAPTANEIRPRTFDPDPPSSYEFPVFGQVLSAAIEFWQCVHHDVRVSGTFRETANQCAERLRQLEAVTPHIAGV
ncbi:MAG: type II toxin-antitoxin system HipA family toxin YjjJ [Myxococcota bacterium]